MLIGIVGKPNVGKSTFFKAATLADVLIANYPFATIKPNHAIGYVKIEDLSPEFNKVSNPREGYVKDGDGVKGKWRFVPFEMADVAGLVEGASEGKGLGNQFLDDLTNAVALIHVVDMSGETDAEGKPALESDYDPCEDVVMIENELDKWYLGIFQKVWKTLSRNIEVQKTEFSEAVAKQFSGLKVSEDDVKEVVLKNDIEIDNVGKWTEVQLEKFARALRKHTKPMIIAANKIDRPKAKENFEKVKEKFDYPITTCFAEGELALKEADAHNLVEYVPGSKDFEIVGDLNEKQEKALESVKEILDKYGSTGVQEVANKTVFDLLRYICVFPAGAKLEDSKGNVLPDCYLMPPGSTALDFAFRIHQDIGKNFVKAINVRTKKAVGKDYKLKNRDGIEILTR